MITENGYKAIEFLHQKFLECGEILEGNHLASIILDFETFENITLTDGEILKSVWYASDDFVESMVQNEYDTPLSENFKLCDRGARVDRWEAMRPSVCRLAQIEKTIRLAQLEELIG